MTVPSPATQALAFRIWAYCTPREWDCTVVEIAEALGESTPRVSATCQHRGWNQRLRKLTPDWAGEPGYWA